MTEGLARTFWLLAKTDNEAAVRILIPALDSPHTTIQEGSLKALLARRSAAGGSEILGRLHDLPPRFKGIILQRPGCLTRTLRDAILGPDPQMRQNACAAAVWFREYDLIPTLLNVVEDPSRERTKLAAKTMLDLVLELYQELATPRAYRNRRDPQVVRRHTVDALEKSVHRFAQHKCREVVEAFLLSVARDNVTLNKLLKDPHDAAYLAVIDVLSHSPHGGVMRLLLSLLDDPQVPSAALSVVAKRSDLRFVSHLLRKIGREPSATVAQNLKRIESIAWMDAGASLFGQLDDAAQHAAVQLVMTSGTPRLQAFAMVKQLLLYGKPGGRREAARVLKQFTGAEANALVLKILDDLDPLVQAAAVGQLRGRGIPGVLRRILGKIDSPHAAVRRAARASLAEFSFERYLTTFDVLADDVRQSTGMLVRKVDVRTIPLLGRELQSPVRTRRIRGLKIVQTIGAVDELEQAVTGLLEDSDHMVRMEAATALADGRSEHSRQALAQALADRSPAVQEAAQRSLQVRDRSA